MAPTNSGFARRRWQIALLLVMSALGVAFGAWLFKTSEVAIGCFYMGIWLFLAQRYSLWLMIPEAAPREVAPRFTSRLQRLLFWLFV